MNKTLLVTNKKDWNELYSLNLSVYADTEVLSEEHFDDALLIMEEGICINLIVLDAVGVDSLKVDSFCQEIIRNYSFVPMIVLGPHANDTASSDRITFLSVQKDLKPLLQCAAKFLGVSAEGMAAKAVPDLYPIPAGHFRYLKKVNCDVYIRGNPSKANSGFGNITSFNKILNAESKDIGVIVNQCIAQGIQDFFIPSLDRLKLVNAVSHQMLKLMDSKNSSATDKIKVIDSGMGIVADELLSMGLSPQVAELANVSIESLSKVTKDFPTLDKLLTTLLTAKSSYRYRHCQLITYLAYELISAMPWNSEELREKITHAAFFHDIVLPSDKLAMINDAKSFEQASLTAEEKDLLNMHALQAALLVQSFPCMPLGTDTIIKQHHGSKNGIGFATSFPGDLLHLSMLFLIAEDVATYIFENWEGAGQSLDYSDLWPVLEKKYPLHKYKDLIVLMREILLSNCSHNRVIETL